MEKKYCVYCGEAYEEPTEICPKCKKNPNPKENLFFTYLKEHTKDKFKGDFEDNVYELIKNYLLSHLYGIVLTVSLVTAAVVTFVGGTQNDDYMRQVNQRPDELQVYFVDEETPENSGEQNNPNQTPNQDPTQNPNYMAEVDPNSELYDQEEFEKYIDSFIYYYGDTCMTNSELTEEQKSQFWSNQFEADHMLGEAMSDVSVYGEANLQVGKRFAIAYYSELPQYTTEVYDPESVDSAVAKKAKNAGYPIYHIKCCDWIFNDANAEIGIAPDYAVDYSVYLIYENGEWKILEETRVD